MREHCMRGELYAEDHLGVVTKILPDGGAMQGGRFETFKQKRPPTTAVEGSERLGRPDGPRSGDSEVTNLTGTGDTCASCGRNSTCQLKNVFVRSAMR